MVDLASGAAVESRTLSANDSARSFVDDVKGWLVGFVVANGLSLAGEMLELEEKGFALVDTELVSDVAPNTLAPISC